MSDKVKKPSTKKQWNNAERLLNAVAAKIGIDAYAAADAVRRASGAGTGVFRRNRRELMLFNASEAARKKIEMLVNLMETIYFDEPYEDE